MLGKVFVYCPCYYTSSSLTQAEWNKELSLLWSLFSSKHVHKCIQYIHDKLHYVLQILCSTDEENKVLTSMLGGPKNNDDIHGHWAWHKSFISGARLEESIQEGTANPHSDLV